LPTSTRSFGFPFVTEGRGTSVDWTVALDRYEEAVLFPYPHRAARAQELPGCARHIHWYILFHRDLQTRRTMLYNQKDIACEPRLGTPYSIDSLTSTPSVLTSSSSSSPRRLGGSLILRDPLGEPHAIEPLRCAESTTSGFAETVHIAASSTSPSRTRKGAIEVGHARTYRRRPTGWNLPTQVTTFVIIEDSFRSIVSTL
jgi:hypothetical protein